MKIELQLPFSNDYKVGYIVTNKENRKMIILVDNSNRKTSTAYARYLLSVKLGRYLESNEQADHIDGNKCNDFIDNLQVLTAIENTRKYRVQSNTSRKMIELICPICGVVFIKEHNLSHLVKNSNFTVCSKECLYKMSSLKKSKEELIDIGNKQVIRIFRK
jgi:hypothetical protein